MFKGLTQFVFDLLLLCIIIVAQQVIRSFLNKIDDVDFIINSNLISLIIMKYIIKS